MDEPLDCLIVGGGPAGLTAAIYLARFHLKVLVIDDGKGRAASIPCTHNLAGFPGGISGKEVLKRMREQAELYGAQFKDAFVTRLDKTESGFCASWGGGSVAAKTGLLATGTHNRRPPMDEELHDEALARGLIRYCPICDGYEVTDKKVGVIGSDRHGVAEAMFIRSYTPYVTLIAPDKALHLDRGDTHMLQTAQIACIDGPAQAVAISDGCILVETAQGTHSFDSVYAALGSDPHILLAEEVGAKLGENGCLSTDGHQRTSIPGLYAAGDVVIGLDQISHAMGEGGVAATTIRNDLAERQPLLR